ncbi:sulfite exporter TauE/SafE family protein [Bermanella sp. R86510]|uniref:sulfite exporter TauE/SafE family protein n=1 Tax=unclassified Bermanella TaxID=2627862 RepID=UPI0037CA79AC
MNEPLTYLTAWLLGFMGSIHCMGMCGGIVGALSMNGPKPMLQLGYHIGRISTYGLLGFIAGFAGLWLADSHDYWGTILRVISGLLLVLMGLYLLGQTHVLTWLERSGSVLWRRLQPLSRPLIPTQHGYQAVALGLIWGFLPCGLVYSTLSWALVSADPVKSATLMMVFGLGNLPALFSFALFTQRLTKLKQNTWVKLGMGLLVIGFGVWTALGPFLQH